MDNFRKNLCDRRTTRRSGRRVGGTLITRTNAVECQ